MTEGELRGTEGQGQWMTEGREVEVVEPND